MYVKIHDIVPYERNARHNASAVPVVADSIKEFGLRGTIGLESRERPVIVWGHTRVEACRSLGWDEIPDSKIEYCDDLTDIARQVGSVNAIRIDPDTGRLTGGNFDGEGMLAGLHQQGHTVAGKRVLLVGTGGAGKSIAWSLAQQKPARLALYNRSPARAQALLERLQKQFPALDLVISDGNAQDYDVVINATSLGLKDDDPLPLDPNTLRAGALVCEVVMRADGTALLAAWPILSLIAVVVGWDAAVRLELFSSRLLPAPATVVHAAREMYSDGTPFADSVASFRRALQGFVVGSLIAIVVGTLTGRSRIARGLLEPTIQIVRPIPAIALVPLAILWFGIGEMSKVFIIIIGTFVPCLLNAYNGVRLVDPDLYDVIRVLGGKRRDEIFHVCFPASFPAVFAGLQISLSSAWTCVLAAELMNSRDGMGFLIKRGMDTHQPTLVLGGMVLIAAAAYGTSLLVTLFEGKLCPWKRTIENL